MLVKNYRELFNTRKATSKTTWHSDVLPLRVWKTLLCRVNHYFEFWYHYTGPHLQVKDPKTLLVVSGCSLLIRRVNNCDSVNFFHAMHSNQCQNQTDALNGRGIHSAVMTLLTMHCVKKVNTDVPCEQALAKHFKQCC